MNELPIAITDANFIRDEIDWHIPKYPLLCYGLNQEWHWELDKLWSMGADSSNLIMASSAWCIRNIDSLITRHLHGHRYNIHKWPKQWGQWSHGEEGVLEFMSFLKDVRLTADKNDIFPFI